MEPSTDLERSARSGRSCSACEPTLGSVSYTKPIIPSHMQNTEQESTSKRYQTLKFLKHNYTIYRRIFTVIFTVNLVVLIAMVCSASGSLTPVPAANAAAVNLAMGVLFRQEQVINALYQTLTSLPHSWPLWLRAQAANVYHYGGVHSGCGVAAVAWFCLYAALATKAYVGDASRSNTEALATAWILVVVFIVLIGSAYPSVRRRFHDTFEIFHRFTGWAALSLFWAHVLFSAHSSANQNNVQMGTVLIRSVTFWCVLIATLPIVVSWTQLRRRTVTAERLSNHAIRLHFNQGKIDTCFGIRVSTNPLFEWHSFATIPEVDYASSKERSALDLENKAALGASDVSVHSSTSSSHSTPPTSHPVQATTIIQEYKRPGFSILVSHAGDWTQHAIQSPPTTLWTRGSPTRGVIYGARLFNRVVVVTTGSGIGPCLSLLVAHTVILPSSPRVIWSASSPEKTFGTTIMDSVRSADPEAVVWDTRAQGRPDLVSMAIKLVNDSDAEAVYIISNPKVCKLVTSGLQDRGILAYSPLFDS